MHHSRRHSPPQGAPWLGQRYRAQTGRHALCYAVPKLQRLQQLLRCSAHLVSLLMLLLLLLLLLQHATVHANATATAPAFYALQVTWAGLRGFGRANR